jgi:hypothetical protein
MCTFWGGTDGFLINFDIDNCLLKKFHYTCCFPRPILEQHCPHNRNFSLFFKIPKKDGRPTFLRLGMFLPCEQQVLIELAINSGDFW